MGDNTELLKQIGTMFNSNMESFEAKFQENISVIKNNMEMLDQKINGNINSKFEMINSKVENLSRENKELSTAVEKQNERLDILEKKDLSGDRRLNIIINGIIDQYYQGILIKIITTLKEIDVDITKYCIKGLFKIGKKKWSEDGPIRVTFISSILRNDVLKNKHKLKSNPNNIFIREDLSENDREVRKKLSRYSLDAKNKGKKVFMRNDKLVIDGKTWSLEELEEFYNDGTQNKNESGNEERGSQNQMEGIIENTQGGNEADLHANADNPRKRGLSISPTNPYDKNSASQLPTKKGKPDKNDKPKSQRSLQEMWNNQVDHINSAQTSNKENERENYNLDSNT